MAQIFCESLRAETLRWGFVRVQQVQCAVFALAVLAIGAACGAGGVGLIATAFIGLPMVADMLILLGGGAAVIAIALVVIWLAIWLFIRMVIGWVRLLVRLGKRWCRKEIAA